MRSLLPALAVAAASLAGCVSTPIRREPVPPAAPPPPPQIRPSEPETPGLPAPPAIQDPTLPTLRDAAIDEFKAAFAGAAGRPRYVLALSPTCSDCRGGIETFGKAIAEHPNADVRVIVVWLPVLASDIGPPGDSVRRLLRDPRVVEFWDPDHRVSARMIDRAMRLARSKGEQPDFDEDTLAWDVAMFFPANASWEEPFPTPAWSDAPVEQAVPRVRRSLTPKR